MVTSDRALRLRGTGVGGVIIPSVGIAPRCWYRRCSTNVRVEAKTLNNSKINSFVKEILVTMLRRKALNVDNEVLLDILSIFMGLIVVHDTELAPVVIAQPTGRPWLS
ncbi:hypothetical protein Tco_0414749 [Tanacetum coccineum]